jgi:hypothetical protein
VASLIGTPGLLVSTVNHAGTAPTALRLSVSPTSGSMKYVLAARVLPKVLPTTALNVVDAAVAAGMVLLRTRTVKVVLIVFPAFAVSEAVNFTTTSASAAPAGTVPVNTISPVCGSRVATSHDGSAVLLPWVIVNVSALFSASRNTSLNNNRNSPLVPLRNVRSAGVEITAGGALLGIAIPVTFGP